MCGIAPGGVRAPPPPGAVGYEPRYWLNQAKTRRPASAAAGGLKRAPVSLKNAWSAGWKPTRWFYSPAYLSAARAAGRVAPTRALRPP